MRPETPPPDDDQPDDAFTELDEALTRAGETTSAGDGHDPPGRNRTVLLSAIFAAAVMLLSAVIGYAASMVAVDRAAEHTDSRVAVLEGDLQQRREAAAQQNAGRDAQIAELRRLVCVFADHSQPRDKAVEQIRANYGCDNPSPAATPGPSPSPR